MRVNKTVFCPMEDEDSPNGICGMMMRKVGVKTGQHTRDRFKKLIPVTRVFYGCPKCQTVVWFEVREDGRPGDLHLDLAFEKKHKMKLIKDSDGNIIGTRPI